jgi:hypothetical protein
MSVSISHPTERPNFSVVTVGDLTIWFSYRTPIAFHTFETGTVARENVWGPTTGKHLGLVGVDKKKRMRGADFEDRLTAVTRWSMATLLDATS